MMSTQNIPSLDRLIHALKKWPGIGPLTATRLAQYLLKEPSQEIDQLCQALKDIKTHIKKCQSCLTYTEETELCSLCASPVRKKELLCIVEKPFDITHIEASGKFKGHYHVLHGVLSPLNQVRPEDLSFSLLMKKIHTKTIKEIIVALSADMEGDITALYIGKLMKGQDIKISRLAHGIPFGGNIDYIDERTLGRALENRVEML